MFQEGELKSLGIAAGLIGLNIAVMWIFAFTPLSAVNDLLFGAFFFLGVIVFGAMLTVGLYIARKGIGEEDKGLSIAGISIIQIAYGVFGAGIIGMLSPQLQGLVIIITGLICVGITILAGLLVYGTGYDFSNWDRYTNYIFLAVLGLSFIGSLTPTLIAVVFFLALTGFIVYLIHQIYMIKTRPGQPYMNGLGIYTAFMGVFVQVIQLVIEMLLRR